MGAASIPSERTMTAAARAGTPPAHSSRISKTQLARRLQEARAALSSCNLCERRCGIDRTRGESAPCRLNADTFTFRRYLSLTDELEIIPSLRVYLAGC